MMTSLSYCDDCASSCLWRHAFSYRPPPSTQRQFVVSHLRSVPTTWAHVVPCLLPRFCRLGHGWAWTTNQRLVGQPPSHDGAHHVHETPTVFVAALVEAKRLLVQVAEQV